MRHTSRPMAAREAVVSDSTVSADVVEHDRDTSPRSSSLVWPLLLPSPIFNLYLSSESCIIFLGTNEFVWNGIANDAFSTRADRDWARCQ
jgi:hypothetical protein